MRQLMRMKGESQGARPSLVITGLGWFSSLGPDVPSTWRRLCDGETGIAPIRRWDASGYPAHVAAEILDVPAPRGLPESQLARLRRGGRFFVAAADEAWASAGLDALTDRRRIGLAVGVSISHLHHGYLRETWRSRNAAGSDVDLSRSLADADVAPLHYDRLLGNTIAAVAADRLGCGGPQVSIDTACAASMHALADACRLLWRGRADAMVVGGASGLVTPFVVVAFGRIGALSGQPVPREASRPFDARRDGFVLGEGGGAVVVERLEHGERRGATILAEIAGVGLTHQRLVADGPVTRRGSGGARDAARAGGRGARRRVRRLHRGARHVDPQERRRPKPPRSRRSSANTPAGSACPPTRGSSATRSRRPASSTCLPRRRPSPTACVPPRRRTRCPTRVRPRLRARTSRGRASCAAALANAFAFGGQNACAALWPPSDRDVSP